MPDDSALITFILDESGSMEPLAKEARDGFNQFLEEQRDHGGKTWWTLTTFNNRPRTRYAAMPGHEVLPLGDDYQPGGMTALLDAVGWGITKTHAYLETLGSETPSDVLIVILTDGMENASQQWNTDQVAHLIAEAEGRGWQFIFLGANQDSWSTAHRLGMRKAAVVDWAPNRAAHARAMEEAKIASMDYRNLKVQQSKYRDRRDR